MQYIYINKKSISAIRIEIIEIQDWIIDLFFLKIDFLKTLKVPNTYKTKQTAVLIKFGLIPRIRKSTRELSRNLNHLK